MKTQERIDDLNGDELVDINVVGCEHDFVRESRLDIMDNGYGTELALEDGLPMLVHHDPTVDVECEEEGCVDTGEFYTVDYLVDADESGVYYCGQHIDHVYVSACTEAAPKDDEEYDGVAFLNYTALRVTDADEVTGEFSQTMLRLVHNKSDDDQKKARHELQTAVLGLTSLLARNATLAD